MSTPLSKAIEADSGRPLPALNLAINRSKAGRMFTQRNEPAAEFRERFVIHQPEARAENSKHRAAWRIHRATLSERRVRRSVTFAQFKFWCRPVGQSAYGQPRAGRLVRIVAGSAHALESAADGEDEIRSASARSFSKRLAKMSSAPSAAGIRRRNQPPFRAGARSKPSRQDATLKVNDSTPLLHSAQGPLERRTRSVVTQVT